MEGERPKQYVPWDMEKLPCSIAYTSCERCGKRFDDMRSNLASIFEWRCRSAKELSEELPPSQPRASGFTLAWILLA